MAVFITEFSLKVSHQELFLEGRACSLHDYVTSIWIHLIILFKSINISSKFTTWKKL